MLSYTTVILIVCGSVGLLISACALILGMVYVLRDRSALSPIRHDANPADSGALTNVQPDVLTALAQRVTVLEADAAANREMYGSYAQLSNDLAAVKGMIPDVLAFYDKAHNQLHNQAKRDGMREKRAKEKEAKEEEEGIAVEDAVAQMGLAGNGTPSAEIVQAESAPSNGQPGAYGSGGRR